MTPARATRDLLLPGAMALDAEGTREEVSLILCKNDHLLAELALALKPDHSGELPADCTKALTRLRKVPQ
jgi:hypothetical protein